MFAYFGVLFLIKVRRRPIIKKPLAAASQRSLLQSELVVVVWDYATLERHEIGCFENGWLPALGGLRHVRLCPVNGSVLLSFVQGLQNTFCFYTWKGVHVRNIDVGPYVSSRCFFIDSRRVVVVYMTGVSVLDLAQLAGQTILPRTCRHVCMAVANGYLYIRLRDGSGLIRVYT